MLNYKIPGLLQKTGWSPCAVSGASGTGEVPWPTWSLGCRGRSCSDSTGKEFLHLTLFSCSIFKAHYEKYFIISYMANWVEICSSNLEHMRRPGRLLHAVAWLSEKIIPPFLSNSMTAGSIPVRYLKIKCYWLTASPWFWFGHRHFVLSAFMNQTGAEYDLGKLGHWQSRSLTVMVGCIAKNPKRQFRVCEQFFQGAGRFSKTNPDHDRLSL